MDNNTKRKIDTVLFDFGGVISEEGFREGLKSLARLASLNEETFFRQAEDLIYTTGYVLGKATERDYWQAIRNATGIAYSDDFMRHELLSRFIIRPWMMEIINKIKSEHYRVGILSDQTDWLDVLNEKYAIFEQVDFVFNSFYLGKGKRDPSLFDDIARNLSIESSSILFIDDNLGHCERARQNGFCVIHYTDEDSFLVDMTVYFSPTIFQKHHR